MMNRGEYGLVFLILVVFLFSSANVGAQSKEMNRLSLLTGGTGGVYYPYGGALAQVISKYVPNTSSTAEVTAAAVDNIKLLKAGKGELALVIADVASDAILGKERFEKDGKIPLRTLAVLYGNLNHMVVLKDSGIKSVPELKGKKVSVGAPGSATEVKSSRILEAFGVDPAKDIRRERLSVAESVGALKDRKIDAFCWDGGLPTAAVMDLAATPGISARILPQDKALPALIQKYGPVYYNTLIPKGTYAGMEADVPVIGVATKLVCMESFDPGLAYEIVKAILEHKSDLVAVHKAAEHLSLQGAVTGSSIPFHPGALKYYAEKGIKVP
jgi:TRAP transporter TAXI family solute receptor